MSDIDPTSTNVILVSAGALVVTCYVVLILLPAWRCYGRLWEKLAAGFMTLFILGTMVGIGAAIGLAVVWSYDRYA